MPSRSSMGPVQRAGRRAPGKALAGWLQQAKAARLKPDSELAQGLSRERLEQLRSLGYPK